MDFLNWLKRLKPKNELTPDLNDFDWYKKQLNNMYDIDINKLTVTGERNLVSIVLPVYNGEKYLRFAIESVINQTYKNWELIIVDDGSEDMSGEIAKKFADSIDNIKYIRLDTNMKLPYALNMGFSSASGEFYTWISDDNILLPKFLERFVTELEFNKDAAMVFGNLILIDESGETKRGYGWFEIPPLSGNVILPTSVKKLNIHANNTIGAAFIYRSCVADFIGGYSVDRFGIEDYDYWMRINEVFNIVHTSFSEPLYKYRLHNKSLTSRDLELDITKNRPSLMHRDYLRRKYILSYGDAMKLDSDSGKVIPKYSLEILRNKVEYISSLSDEEIEKITNNITCLT